MVRKTTKTAAAAAKATTTIIATTATTVAPSSTTTHNRNAHLRQDKKSSTYCPKYFIHCRKKVVVVVLERNMPEREVIEKCPQLSFFWAQVPFCKKGGKEEKVLLHSLLQQYRTVQQKEEEEQKRKKSVESVTVNTLKGCSHIPILLQWVARLFPYQTKCYTLGNALKC